MPCSTMHASTPAPGEYVGIGAARQAAWVLSGEDNPPPWTVTIEDTFDPSGTGEADDVRDRYAALLATVHGS